MYQIPEYFEQTSERLKFRALKKEDISAWKAFFINNSSLRFVGTKENEPTDHLAEEWVTRQMLRNKEEGLGMLAVIEKESGNLIGLSGILPRVVDGESEMEIAYSLIPKYWGKGYATEAACQLHKFGKKHKIASHFISMVHLENQASMNVAQKNGMHPIKETEFMNMKVRVFGTTR